MLVMSDFMWFLKNIKVLNRIINSNCLLINEYYDILLISLSIRITRIFKNIRIIYK